MAAHGDDVERLVTNEAARAAEDNPLGRLMSAVRTPAGDLLLSTTTEHLAERLGHAVQKAFDGRLLVRFSHETRLARVSWRRD
jgi:hypothetical protein